MSKMENNSCTNIQELVAFSNATFLDQQLNLSSEQITNLQSKDHPNPFSLIQSSEASPFSTSYDHEQAETVPVSECLEDSSPPFSVTGFAAKNKNLVGNKRKRNNNRFGVEEKPKEVVLVRAKRGQATDSHSLAERVRRGKINEKLRCLQDLVPGCYKAMGMAVMLDVIIDYVQSLQHQIEFLSMKLTAASMHFDFNTSEMDATDTLQRNTGTCEVQETEKMEGGFGGYSYFNSTWPLH